MNLSLSQIAAAVGGRLIGPDATVTGPVVTDSRQASPGALFVAVHGERTDGHAHLGSAGALGAVGAIVSDLKAARTGLSEEPAEAAESEDLPMGLVLVEDTVVALGALARTHLAGLRQGAVDRGERLTVVAMTGSVGKTTTKDLTRQLLAASGPTVAPRASFNNEIGLPLTVLEADESTRYLVLEMGASGAGHIAYLTDIAPLDAAAVLMIGHAHMGGFGSIEGVAAAKAEIIAGLLPEGTAILNADDARCAAMAELAPARVLTFSAQGEPADLQAENVVLDEAACAAFDLHLPGLDAPRRVQLAVAGAHNVANALAAAGLALAAGLEPELIAERLGSVSIESPHRMVGAQGRSSPYRRRLHPHHRLHDGRAGRAAGSGRQSAPRRRGFRDARAGGVLRRRPRSYRGASGPGRSRYAHRHRLHPGGARRSPGPRGRGRRL